MMALQVIALCLLLHTGGALAAAPDVSADVSANVSADGSLDVSARSLYDLGLPVASEAQFIAILDRGAAAPGYGEALGRLVRIAALTDDWSLLRGRILDVPESHWPKQEKAWLGWLRARALFEGMADGADADDLAEARRLLAAIPLSSDAAIRARYLAGLIQGRLGKPHLAHRAFVDVLRAVGRHDGHLVPEHRAAELDRSREHAILGIARLYAHAGMDLEAVKILRSVPGTSPRRADAHLILAWMQPGLPRRAQRTDAEGAAAARLEALLQDAAARDVCADRAAFVRQLESAEATFRPVHAQVGTLLERWTTEAGLDDPDFQRLEWIYRRFAEPELSGERPVDLPVELRTELGVEVGTIGRKLARIETERGLVEKQRAGWRPGAADAAVASLDEEAARLERLGGAAILARVTAEDERLRALLDAGRRAASSLDAIPCAAPAPPPSTIDSRPG
ncbi:MAG: hypothetical protein Q8P18_05170 [Pseudomonadota bacterium]|nr:hypothetical protein [Pseudomonadota bacterium]